MSKNIAKAKIHGFSMEKYGLNCLTGEACAFGLRLLFDVSDEGKRLLADFFGVHEVTFAGNWNPTVNGKPATGSILLPRELWLPLCLFIMFQIEQCDIVLINKKGTNSVFGYNESDGDVDLNDGYLNEEYDIRRNYASKDPSISRGGRNVHQFTKRTM